METVLIPIWSLFAGASFFIPPQRERELVKGSQIEFIVSGDGDRVDENEEEAEVISSN